MPDVRPPIADCPVGTTLALATIETVPKAEVELTPLRVTVTGTPVPPKSEKGASETIIDAGQQGRHFNIKTNRNSNR